MDHAKIKTILLSRDDNLGDAVLLIPAAGLLKQQYPHSRILFLGRSYQRSIIEACPHFDGFIEWDEIKTRPLSEQAAFLAAQNIDVFVSVKPRRPIVTAAKMAKIPHRIGSMDRIFHFFTCNHIPLLWRQKSRRHEAQSNVRLLSPLLKKVDYSVQELLPFVRLEPPASISSQVAAALSTDKFNLILHPLSNGHAKEWPIESFLSLIRLLDTDKYNIIVTGSEKERGRLKQDLLEPAQSKITDLTGKLSISELCQLIAHSDGLLAASTGPLHIAAATGIHTLGLYVQRWQLRPGRYGPIGKNASVMVHDEHCPTCLANKNCDCIERITPQRVAEKISHWRKIPPTNDPV